MQEGHFKLVLKPDLLQNIPVIIQGEKIQEKKEIHNTSPRKNKPFIE